MTGLGTKMKLAGYATHQVGKWDAGMATPDHMQSKFQLDVDLTPLSDTTTMQMTTTRR